MTHDNRYQFQLRSQMEEWNKYNRNSSSTASPNKSRGTTPKYNRPILSFSPSMDGGVVSRGNTITSENCFTLYEDESKRRQQHSKDPMSNKSIPFTPPNCGTGNMMYAGPTWVYTSCAKLWACDYCSEATFHTYNEALIHEENCQMNNKKSMMMANSNTAAAAASQTVKFLFALPKDVDSLSDRQCYVRSNFVEVFAATKRDVASRHSRGAQKLFEHQIGIRCIYCATSTNPGRRGERAVCYPSSISRIYQTVADMCRFHFPVCSFIPKEIQQAYANTKTTRPRGVGSPQQYWIDSAKEIGLVDTDQGIRYAPPQSSPPTGAPTTLPQLPYDHSNAGTVTTDDTTSQHSTSPSLVGSPLFSPANKWTIPPPTTTNEETLDPPQKISRVTTTEVQKEEEEWTEANMLLLLRNLPAQKKKVSC